LQARGHRFDPGHVHQFFAKQKTPARRFLLKLQRGHASRGMGNHSNGGPISHSFGGAISVHASALQRCWDRRQWAACLQSDDKNILRLHDLGEVNGMNFISTAYLEDRICLDHEGQFKTSAGSGVEICDSAGCALAAAHAEDVIHRDLKPQNILVDKNDQINVADFGLARSFAEGAVGMIHGGAFRAPLTDSF
jgi:serine/threonine protein kinase